MNNFVLAILLLIPQFSFATSAPASAALCALELMREPSVMGYVTDRPEAGDMFIYEKNVFLVEATSGAHGLKVRRLNGDLKYPNARSSLDMTFATPGAQHELERFVIVGHRHLSADISQLYSAPLKSIEVGSVVITFELGCPYVVTKLEAYQATLAKLDSKDLRYRAKNLVRTMRVSEEDDVRTLEHASVVGFFDQKIEEGAAPTVFSNWRAFNKAYFGGR